MAMDNQDQVGAVSAQGWQMFKTVEQHIEQATQLTEEVAAISTATRSMNGTERTRHFACNYMRHECSNCHQRIEVGFCFICDKQGHLASDCCQKNDQGCMPGTRGLHGTFYRCQTPFCLHFKTSQPTYDAIIM